MTGSSSLLAALTGYPSMLRSQRWTERQWAAYRARGLRETLAAAVRIPFYAARMPAGAGQSGRPPTPEEFAAIPVLRRCEVRDLAASIQALHTPGTRHEAHTSSGSIGMPAEFLFDRSHQRVRFAARARYLLASGWTPWCRSAWIIHFRIGESPDSRFVGHRLLPGSRFLNVFSSLEKQVAWLKRLNPRVIYTLPSNLDGLVARLSRDDLPALRHVLAGGEVVDDSLRRKVRDAFGLEIADNYGTTEAFIAWRCPGGSYHLNAEHVMIEIVDRHGRPSAPGALGRVLVTTLQNRLMPLVRYEIGDYAKPACGPCSCGRTLPIIGSIAGRSIQLFRLADGRLVSPYEVVVRIKLDPEVRQFQLVQKTCDQFVYRYVAENHLPVETRARFVREFEAALGVGVQVGFERVAEIERGPTGKYLTAISEVPAAV